MAAVSHAIALDHFRESGFPDPGHDPRSVANAGLVVRLPAVLREMNGSS
jgi:hypothetical protein